MHPVVVGSLLTGVIASAIALVVLHWQFRNWPPRRWKAQVLRRVADLRARQSELAGPDPDGVQSRADRLAADLFGRHLQSIPVDRLAEFSGIGPGTVDRVTRAGARTLAD